MCSKKLFMLYKIQLTLLLPAFPYLEWNDLLHSQWIQTVYFKRITALSNWKIWEKISSGQYTSVIRGKTPCWERQRIFGGSVSTRNCLQSAKLPGLTISRWEFKVLKIAKWVLKATGDESTEWRNFSDFAWPFQNGNIQRSICELQ